MSTSQKGRAFSLGLDVGGTKIKAIALDSDGIVVEQLKVPSGADKGPAAVRKALGEAISHFRLLDIPYTSIGVGCAGSVDHSLGVVRNSPNFNSWKDISIKKWIEEDFQTPAVIENDANCAIYGEWKVGAAKDFKNVMLLTLGTGIGGGLILDGNIFRGATGTGGELGHFSLYANGIQCPCGNSGCFERYCSASALIAKVDGKYSAKEIFARHDEEPFVQIVQTFLKEFKVGLTSLSNIFDPDVILLGGGMSQGVYHFLPEIRTWLREHAFPAVATHVKVEMTEHSNLSGAIGAALLARDHT